MPPSADQEPPQLPTTAPCYVIYPMTQGMLPWNESQNKHQHQHKHQQKWARQMVVILMDEVLREHCIPDMLTELDWQGNDVQDGGILPRSTLHHKRSIAMTLMMELVSRVVQEECAHWIHSSIRELIDDYVQLDIAQSILDQLLMDAMQEQAPAFIQESQREVLADDILAEIMAESTSQHTQSIVQDVLRWQSDQARLAIKQADIQLAHELGEYMLDRMIVESMLTVIRDKSPQLICDSLAEHVLHRWMVETWIDMCTEQQQCSSK